MELYEDQHQVEWSQETDLEESMQRLNLWDREMYPERPGLPDCAHYIRTGTCGYGSKCRYNHPRDRVISLVDGGYPERVGEPVCEYYLRTGTCKFGLSCKFNHPKNGGGSLMNAPLNLYGYPLRPGEKECSYYSKMGQCKFGITCKFDHPQPAGASMPASAHPFYPNVQSFSSPSPEQYDSSATNYSVTRPPLLTGSYVPGAYAPVLLPGVVPVSNWNPYPGSVSSAPAPGAQHSPGPTPLYGVSQLRSSPSAYSGPFSQFSASGSVTKDQQFPQRPDQSDCSYYMRTGDCKYGSSCRYNHPPEWALSKSACPLSPLGLPLRLGVEACAFYLQKGYCKFGRVCKYDHPMPTEKYSPASSYTEMPEVQDEHIAGSKSDINGRVVLST